MFALLCYVRLLYQSYQLMRLARIYLKVSLDECKPAAVSSDNKNVGGMSMVRVGGVVNDGQRNILQNEK